MHDEVFLSMILYIKAIFSVIIKDENLFRYLEFAQIEIYLNNGLIFTTVATGENIFRKGYIVI